VKLYRLNEFRPGYSDFVASASAVPALVITVVCTGLIVAGLATDVPPGWFRWPLYALVGLFAWIFFGIYRRSRGEQNWLLAYDGGSVTIKFRSFLNAHFPGDARVIVTLDRRDIAWFRRTRESMLKSSSDGTEKHTLHYLDIGLADGVDTAPLAAALQAERTEQPPGTWSRSRYIDHPARLVEDGRVLRVSWGSQGSSIRPSLKKTIARLSSLAPVREFCKEDTDLTKPADPADAEGRILQLLERDDTLAATTLAKDVYKISLTEARTFVDDLQGKGTVHPLRR
jgi:hypothetical protein